MFFLGPPPWFHLLFSEATVFAVRARYRDDGARRWDDAPTGLNKLSISHFLSLARGAGFEVEHQHRRAIKRMQLLVKLPILRECHVSFFSVVLRKPRA